MDVPFQCPFCEHANQQGANYCSNCGQRLQLKVCAECGVVNDQIADHCYQCGTAFPATSEGDAAHAACERLRQILHGAATIPSDPGGTSKPSENGEQTGAEPPDVIQTAAQDPRTHHPDAELAIARERFSAERLFRFPDTGDNGLNPDFNLLRPPPPLAPDFDADSAPAQRQLQPVDALQTTGTTDQPLSPARGASLEARSMLRATRAKWIGATVAISIVALAYSIYRIAATNPAGAIRGPSVAPVETSADVRSARLPIRNADDTAVGPRTTATDDPNADAVKALGITKPVASGNEIVTTPSLGAAAPALVSPNQAQPLARDQAASAKKLPSAPPARVQPSAKDSATRAPNARAAAGPITCTEGVAALGLCIPANEENK